MTNINERLDNLERDANRMVQEISAMSDASVNDNARLRAVVDAARYLRAVELQRDKDEAEYAASGTTYGISTLIKAQRALDAALSALDAKGGG